MIPLTDTRPRRSWLARLSAIGVSALRWLGVGAGVGIGVSIGLLAIWAPKPATDTAFALGALIMGFGITAWSAAVGLGETIEGVTTQLAISSGWTESGARSAFFVLSWLGIGWATAAAVTSITLGV